MNITEFAITLEIFDCTSLRNLKITDTKTQLIVQGEDYCKVYDKVKDVNILQCNGKIFLETTLQSLKKKINSKVPNIKLTKLLKNVVTRNNETYNDKLLFNFTKTQNNLKASHFIEGLCERELFIKNKKYLLYDSDTVELDKSFGLKFDETRFVIEKKSNIEIYKKSNGGIIFDSGNFSEVFPMFINNPECVHLTNSDEIKKNGSNMGSNSRIILYNPTNEMILQLMQLIKTNVVKPCFTWIVLPINIQISHNCIDMCNIVSVLFWTCDKLIIPEITTEIFTLECSIVLDNGNICINQHKQTQQNTNQIIVEKIKYKLNDIEKLLLVDVNTENIKLLDKLYFYNIGEQLPVTTFECNECLICCQDFIANPEIKSYMPCGHSFCANCIIQSIKIRQCCPCCRHMSKFTGIIVPSLKSSKMNIFMKLLKKINKERQNDNITLIYTDTFTLGKKISNYVTNNIKNTKCTFVTQENISKIQNNNIVICSADKDKFSKNIKNITDIVIFTTGDYALKTESLGYDYCNGKNGIKIWTLLCDDLDTKI